MGLDTRPTHLTGTPFVNGEPVTLTTTVTPPGGAPPAAPPPGGVPPALPAWAQGYLDPNRPDLEDG